MREALRKPGIRASAACSARTRVRRRRVGGRTVREQPRPRRARKTGRLEIAGQHRRAPRYVGAHDQQGLAGRHEVAQQAECALVALVDDSSPFAVRRSQLAQARVALRRQPRPCPTSSRRPAAVHSTSAPRLLAGSFDGVQRAHDQAGLYRSLPLVRFESGREVVGVSRCRARQLPGAMPKPTAREREPPDVTLKRTWRPPAHRPHVGDLRGRDQHVDRGVAHAERAQRLQAPRRARGRARRRGRRRPPAPP